MNFRKSLAAGVAALLAGAAQGALAQSDGSLSMQEAINVAVNTNPEVAQAQFNKEAIEFEQGMVAAGYETDGLAIECAPDQAIGCIRLVEAAHHDVDLARMQGGQQLRRQTFDDLDPEVGASVGRV